VILRFGDCELDEARVIVCRNGRELKVEPQVFDVLRYLVAHRGRVVRKEELLDEVWGSRFVSESALTTRIKSVRQAVGDDGSRQEIIRTVHGKGYEFVADVTVVDEDRRAERRGPAQLAAPGLPVPLQPLIGRETLLDLLVDTIGTRRLITLVGPGGVGKTAVGFELARRVSARYGDGVHVVELVTVIDHDTAVAAIATAIDVNVRMHTSLDGAIVDALRPKHCLLLLDNCEHLVEPVATLVSRILREAPSVSIMATSRERLAVPGEYVWAVDPLSLAGAEDLEQGELLGVPAVALFVERAKAVDPTFVLDEETAPSVVEICRRLDGVPLAIELAAARAGVIDVAEIARRLDERFGLLKALRRGSDPRHRTLDDAISWSFDLMPSDEKELFASLSVFAGSFDLPSADSMCASGESLELVTRLAERSMLAVRRPAIGGVRYEMLESLREYGRRRIDVDQRLRLFTAHAALFASMAREVERGLQTSSEAKAMARAEGSFADLRAAQRFAVDVADIDTAFQLISSSREFAMRAMRYEVFLWADAARAGSGALDHPLLALLTGISAYGAWVRGDFDLAKTLAQEARERERQLGVLPSGLAERVLANVLYVLDQSDEGNAEATRQIELAEASGNPSRQVHAYYMGAVALSTVSHYERALEYVARARTVGETTGSLTDLASSAVAEGFATRGDDEAALAAFEKADRLARAAGNRWMSAFARTEASGLLVHRGDVELGCAGLADMVDVWYRAGEWSQQWHTLSRCVIALDRIGHPELAAEVVGAIEAHAQLGVAPMSTILRNVAFEVRDSLSSRLGTARAEELRAAGAARPVVSVVHRTRNALLGRTLTD